jgi:hypothetical protein
MFRRSTFALVAGLLLLTAAGASATATQKDAKAILDDILTAVHSLTDVTRNWSASLPDDRRFVVLEAYGNEAFLDRETGLTWEIPDGVPRSFLGARQQCVDGNIGGAKGWRLPSVVELASLVEPGNSDPALPAGIPVAGLPWLRNQYWSATTVADDAEYGWTVHFATGGVQTYRKPLSALAWCVRGPMNADTY